MRKRELQQSLMQEQNQLKKVVDIEKDLELNQNFFLGNNVDREKIIPKKEIRKSCNARITVQQKLKLKIS